MTAEQHPSAGHEAIHPAPREFAPHEIERDPVLRFFHYNHLPHKLQIVSEPFCTLARQIIDTLPRNAERTVALRKLLEAKDAAVRANVDNVVAADRGSAP